MKRRRYLDALQTQNEAIRGHYLHVCVPWLVLRARHDSSSEIAALCTRADGCATSHDAHAKGVMALRYESWRTHKRSHGTALRVMAHTQKESWHVSTTLCIAQPSLRSSSHVPWLLLCVHHDSFCVYARTRFVCAPWLVLCVCHDS